MSKTILITGATGNVSAGVIEHLKNSDHRLIGLVRNPDKARHLADVGVELRQGDMEKPWTLASAFQGVDAVWLLTPPGPRAPEQSSNAVWAARNAGVGHIVRMSAIGASHTAPTINGRLHGLSDAELIGSGIPYTIVRPHFFMQNLLMVSESIARQGVMHLPLGDSRMGLIDSRDISEFAARILTSTGHEGQIYTLTGPASLTMHDVAAAIGQAIGKDLSYQDVSPDTVKRAQLDAGADEWMVHLLLDYFAAYSTNWGDLVTPDFSHVVGKPARSVDDFAHDFVGAFSGR